MASKDKRDYDIVVWGATGFVGRLVCEYLARTEPPVRWAMGGRSRSKLERVRAEVAERFSSAASVPLVEADADDERSLEAMAARARVIATTVGPYGLYGKKLVEACVKQQTDYCDLTGEIPFIRWAIDHFHDAAKASSTRIVPSCGFDSIPSDLGVFFLAEHARQRGKSLAEVRGYVIETKGGLSGGTAASMLLIGESMSRDRSIGRLLMDPYALSPDRAREPGTDRSDKLLPHFDAYLDAWGAPWLMGPGNARVVRRSNALMNYAYGSSFRYSEEMLMPGGRFGVVPGTLLSGAMLLGMSLLGFTPTRNLVAKVVPAPGEGPAPHVRERGRFSMRFLGRLEGDERPTLAVRVAGRGDPGYLATSRMFAESALCLALDSPLQGFEGGVLTTATAMGMQLIERLRRADFTFEREDLF